jgi:anti-sigma factor RsiW
MPEEMKNLSYTRYAPPDMHSESWWIRLLDDHLTSAERELWEAHLVTCSRCQVELAALTQLDTVLRQAPEPPQVRLAFTATTVARVVRRQRVQRWQSLLGGFFIVGLVSMLVFLLVGSAYATFEQSFNVVFAARQLLIRSLVQTLVGLVVTWRTFLPFMTGVALFAYLLLMPNGLMVTFGLLWLSQRKRRAALALASGVTVPFT